RGTCYRAANWISIGMTTGRGKDAPTRAANRSIKEVLGYPLVKDFRERLSQVHPQVAPQVSPQVNPQLALPLAPALAA
ncbi:MAG TPA: hypothetical protein VGQ91_14820, partial [Ideonella sp.]|nr:hypothetical protein [Ideonella sp.]